MFDYISFGRAQKFLLHTELRELSRRMNCSVHDKNEEIIFPFSHSTLSCEREDFKRQGKREREKKTKKKHMNICCIVLRLRIYTKKFMNSQFSLCVHCVQNERNETKRTKQAHTVQNHFVHSRSVLSIRFSLIIAHIFFII